MNNINNEIEDATVQELLDIKEQVKRDKRNVKKVLSKKGKVAFMSNKIPDNPILVDLSLFCHAEKGDMANFICVAMIDKLNEYIEHLDHHIQKKLDLV
jgi:hypothetical protein